MADLQAFWNKLGPADQRSLKFLGVVLVLIVFLLVVGFPLLDRWDRLNKELKDTRGRITKVQTDLNDAVQARQSLARIQEQARLHPKAGTLNQQTAQMLEQLESLPGYRALSVRRLEGLPLREEEEFYRSGVTLQFEGTLEELHRFLFEVEAARPRLKVERLSLTTNAKGSSGIEGQMVITSYAVVLDLGTQG